MKKKILKVTHDGKLFKGDPSVLVPTHLIQHQEMDWRTGEIIKNEREGKSIMKKKKELYLPTKPNEVKQWSKWFEDRTVDEIAREGGYTNEQVVYAKKRMKEKMSAINKREQKERGANK